MEFIDPRHPVLLLGIGSVLMGDEGVGVHFARELSQDALFTQRLDVVDGGTGGFYLWAYFEHYPTVILVDATLDGGAPGTVRRLKPRFSSDFPRSMSTHDIGLRDVVEALQLMGKLPNLHLLTVSIARMQPMQDALSPEVAAAFPRLREALRLILEEVYAPAQQELADGG